MSYFIKQSSASKPLIFLLVQSSDHISPATGLTPTVTISKNGGSFASPAGSVTEIANGWYQVAANATDNNTLGPLILHATASGADPTDTIFRVVAFDPDSTTNFAAVSVTTNNDKTGYALSSAGLDSISTTPPSSPIGSWTFREKLVMLFRRFYGKATVTASQLKSYATDGTTVLATNTLSDNGTTQTQGEAA